MLSDISSVKIRMMSGHVYYHTPSLYLMLCFLPALAAMYCTTTATTCTHHRCSRIYYTLDWLPSICCLLSSFLTVLLLPDEEGNTLSTSGVEGGGGGGGGG